MTDDFNNCPFRTSISQCKKEKCGIWNTDEKDCNINVAAKMQQKMNG
jgi:hypothetical protein